MARLQDYQTVELAFLTTGPNLRVDIPSGFAPTPQLSSPINIGGERGRSCVFTPKELGDELPPESAFSLSEELIGKDNRRVEVYTQDDGEQWFLRWPLPNGSVLTHVRKREDGYEYVRSVVRDLVILERNGGVPAVVPAGSLRTMVSARPGYAETITFFEPGLKPREFARSVELRRPGLLREGARVRHSVAGGVGLRMGGPGGLELTLSRAETEEEAVGILSTVGASLI